MHAQFPVTYSGRGPIAVVTIERPEVRNAVDQPTRQALADAFRQFDAEPEHHVAVLTGAGGRLLRRSRFEGEGRWPTQALRRERRRTDGPYLDEAVEARDSGH